MGDEKLLKQVFNNIPPFYEVVATPLEEKTGSQTNPLTIQGLRKKLKLKTRRCPVEPIILARMREKKQISLQKFSRASSINMSSMATRLVIGNIHVQNNLERTPQITKQVIHLVVSVVTEKLRSPNRGLLENIKIMNKPMFQLNKNKNRTMVKIYY